MDGIKQLRKFWHEHLEHRGDIQRLWRVQTTMKPQDCTGPISILKRLLAIAEIPIGDDLMISEPMYSLSLIHSNMETLLLFLQRCVQDMSLKLIQKRSDGKSVTSIDFD